MKYHVTNTIPPSVLTFNYVIKDFVKMCLLKIALLIIKKTAARRKKEKTPPNE